MKQKIKIDKKMMILDLTENFPEIGQILTDEYNFHCIGCMAASMETLEEGALVHGMTEKEIDKMVEYLNTKIKA
jgi:hybrid cluster-associated redox disulfide protein